MRVSLASFCPWGAWPPIPLRFVLARLLWAQSVRRPGASARARLFSAAPVGAGGWGAGAGRAPAPLSGGGGDQPPLPQLKQDLKQKITTWQREVDLKLMKSLWGAHVRTSKEDDFSEQCVCEPPRACLCCHRPPEMVERDLLYAYQGLKDTAKGEESVEDHLPTSITQGGSNLHSDEDMEEKIKPLDPRVQKLIRTYLEVFGELQPPAPCDKLVQMDLKLKPEFAGHKIRRRPYPAPEEQADGIERQS